MGRMLLGAVLVAAVAGVAWFVFGTTEPAAPGYEPLVDLGTPEPEDAGGPGLVGREGGGPVDGANQPTGGGWFEGIVVDEAGRPLAGLEVVAALQVKHEQGAGRQAENGALAAFRFQPEPDLRRGVRVTTGADGTYRFDGLADERTYTVTADVAPPRLASRVWQTARTILQRSERIVVGEGSPLRGRVVDATGAGIRGTVSASSARSLGGTPWLATSWSMPRLQTDPDGRFQIPAVPHGTVSFTVHVLGVGSRSGIRVDTPTDEEVLLSIDEPGGAVVEGRVTDTAGAAIAGARLTINSGPISGEGTTSVTRAAVTDETGAYRATGLAPGTLHGVAAIADGFVGVTGVAQQTPLDAERPTRVDVTLVKGATIRGRVLTPDGTPLAGAEVGACRRGHGQGGWFQVLATTTSGADGRYTLEGVALGDGLVQARLEGYYMPEAEDGAANPIPWMRMANRGASYEAGEEGAVLEGKDVVLMRGADVSGTVVDDEGAAVPGASVRVALQGQGWSPGLGNKTNWTVTSDGEGRFELTGLFLDSTWQLTARSSTHLTEEPVPLVVPASGAVEKDPVITMKRGASVAGVVQGADGEPAAGVTISAGQATPERAFTDAEGAFELTGLKAGSITVSAQGVSPIPDEARRQLTLDWGQHEKGIALRMPAVFTIGGTIVDEAGEPRAGVYVRARRKQSSRNRRGRGDRSAISSADGTFEIIGLVAGEYTVYAGSAREEGVAAGAADIRLVVTKPERMVIEGRVLGPDGRPVARGSLQVYTGPSGKRRSRTNATITGGRFMARITTDESAVDLEVSQAYDAAGRSLNFVRKRENDMSLSGSIELRLDEGMTLSGTVRARGAGGLADMHVQVSQKGNRHYNPWSNNNDGKGGSARTDEDGRWRVQGLAEGDFTVRVTPGGDWVSPEPIEARAGDEAVVFELTKGLTVEGLVVDPDGAPLPGASVSIHETADSKKARGADTKGGNSWLDSMRLQARCDAGGHFVIRGLPERAVFNVTAHMQGQLQVYVAETISDVAAGSKDLRLTLQRGGMIEGEVVGPDGEGVSNAWIQVSPVDKKSGLKGANTHLGGNTSTFKVGPLLPGRYRLQVNFHGRGYMSPKPIEVTAPSANIRIEVAKAAALEGTLRGADVQGFNVQFIGGGRGASAMVKADGTWTMDGVQGTRGRLFAHKPGDDRYALLEDIDVTAGPHHMTLAVGQAIEGRLDGWDASQGKPNVFARGSGSWIRGVLRDDGTFTISGLPPGEYTVQGWARGASVAPSSKVAAGQTGVVLKITYRQ